MRFSNFQSFLYPYLLRSFLDHKRAIQQLATF